MPAAAARWSSALALAIGLSLAQGNAQAADTLIEQHALADRAAALIRSARRAPSPAESLAQGAEAAALLDRVLLAPANDYLHRRACFDRSVALSQIGRFQETLDRFAADCAALQPLPAYALSALGDAYAGLQQPEQALQHYERALSLADADEGPHAGRIFALADLNRSDEAIELLRERLEQQVSARPRDDQLRLDLLRAWDGWQDEAAESIEQLVEQAPEDAELARHQGRTELLRDRPRAALAAFDRALLLAPGYVAIHLDRVSVLDRLGRPQQAEDLLEQLQAQGDDWLPLQRLRSSRRLDQGSSLDVSLRAARGGAREIAAGEVRQVSQYTSPVFAQHWRAYAAYRRAYADFRGRALEDERIAAGLRWFGDGLRLQVELDDPRDDLVGASGYALSADWRPADDWSFGANYAHNAFDLPLRARGAGTTGDRYGLAARYSPRGQFWLRISAGLTDYSDGNQREELGLSAQWSQPLSSRLNLSLSPGLYAGRNARDDVPYFSPREDASAELAAALQHRTYARLAHRHWQKLEAYAGGYQQQGFAAEAIGGLRYEYRIDFSPGRNARLRIGRDRRVYDGRPEYQSFVELGMQLSW